MASIVVTGDTSGSITLSAPAVAGSNTLTLPANTGTVLTTASSGQSIPKAALPTGSVLQVLQTIKTDTFSEALGANTNSTTNCIEVSITPTSSSSKILVMVSITGSSSYWAGMGAGSFQDRLVRGSTSIAIADAAGSRNRMTTRAGAYSNQVAENMSFNYLDSPATTSSTTYGFRLDNIDNASQTMYLNRSPTDTDSNTSIARTASSIIVMEIAA
jgi:hypothetical protein